MFFRRNEDTQKQYKQRAAVRGYVFGDFSVGDEQNNYFSLVSNKLNIYY